MIATEATYFTWQVPGCSLSVGMRHSVMEWIEGQVRLAFQSVPKRGAETGGLLVGRRLSSGPQPAIMIEGAENIACEHRSGPSFVLSEADSARLSGQLERIQAEGLVVVGFYRSHTRDQRTGPLLVPSPEDRRMLGAVAGASAFLMIRPFSLARISANLMLFNGDQIWRAPDLAPFPFEGAGEAVPEPAPAMDATVGRRAWRRSVPSWVWLPAVGLMAGLSGIKYFNIGVTPPKTAPPGPAPIELTAGQSGPAVVVRWNPSGPGVGSAESASLVVEDGPARLAYVLDRAQLAGGRSAYVPKTRRVLFSLLTQMRDGPGGRGVLIFVDGRQARTAGN